MWREVRHTRGLTVGLQSISQLLSTDKQGAEVRWLFMVSVEKSWVQDEEREQSTDCVRATPDGVGVNIVRSSECDWGWGWGCCSAARCWDCARALRALRARRFARSCCPLRTTTYRTDGFWRGGNDQGSGTRDLGFPGQGQGRKGADVGGDGAMADSRHLRNIEQQVEVRGEVRTCQCMVGISIDSVVAPVLYVRAGLVGEGDRS